MSQTLYRKYRPKNFSEVIAQAHIVRTLSNAVKNNRIGQAYLFTGPRGTGKTSIARILAKTINCTDLKEAVTCEKCPACALINENKTLDIIEIDAASNTGVDNIRELRETVALPPTILKYKVYIIDEVHMLSTGAFNALLKTLEEPPSHVVFILATTEIHKVPETIKSRCQRFDFSRFPIENIIEKLAGIAQAEKVSIDKESLEMIAIAAEGGMRDAESLLSQIISLEDKKITAAEVEEILGTTDKKIIGQVARMIIEDNPSQAIEMINNLLTDGYDMMVFNKALINYFRQLMILQVDSKLKKYFTYEMTAEQMNEMTAQAEKTELAKIVTAIELLLEAQNKISSSMLPQLPLEIAIIKATGKLPTSGKQEAISDKQQAVSGKQESVSSKQQTTRGRREEVEEKNYSANIISDDSDKKYSAERNNNSQKKDSYPGKSLDMDDIKSNWNRLLIDIKPFNHSLCALLSTCQIKSVSGSEIILATPYDFYQEKLNDPQNRLTIEDVLGKILECKVMMKTIVDRTLLPKAPAENSCDEPAPEAHQDSLLDSALEMMGGKIVE